MPLRVQAQVPVKSIKQLARQFSAISRVRDRVSEGKSVIVDVKGANFARPTVENLCDHVAELGHMMRLMQQLEKDRKNKKGDDDAAVDKKIKLPLPKKPTLVLFLKELAGALGVKTTKQWIGNTSWDLKRFCSQLRSFATRTPKRGKKLAFPNVELSVI